VLLWQIYVVSNNTTYVAFQQSARCCTATGNALSLVSTHNLAKQIVTTDMPLRSFSVLKLRDGGMKVTSV
jgi:hypothetical protein